MFEFAIPQVLSRETIAFLRTVGVEVIWTGPRIHIDSRTARINKPADGLPKTP